MLLKSSKTVQLFLLGICCHLQFTVGIPLLGDRFNTRTDVQHILNLALDAADMRETLDATEKENIYKNGGNAVYEINGESTTLTLASLSLNAKETMASDPFYNMFRHAFLELGNVNEGETEGLFDGEPIEKYGNTIVEDLFELNLADIGTEAAIVMNVWMAAAHELFDVLRHCKNKQPNDALAALDRMAAFWIGEGQESGINESGQFLYNLAEAAGERFGQDNTETKVNTDIVGLLNVIQLALDSGSCDNNSGYSVIRDHVKRMTGLMTVPLVQTLIHHIMNVGNEDGSNYVELYALAVIPRVASCNPDVYDTELHLDVLAELTTSQQDSAIKSIQDAYSCLLITCSDVGSYMTGTVPACDDSSDASVTLAGYTTPRLDIRPKSYLDRDLLQMGVFLRFGDTESALDWYEYGFNSEYSFQELALNQVIPSSPESPYDDFDSYYLSPTYADDFIHDVLSRSGPYGNASIDQIRMMAGGILRYFVMYLAVAASLDYAIDECYNQNKESALQFWDAAAAFYIGSIEGSGANGAQQRGHLLFATAKTLCEQFEGTCSGDPTSGSEYNAVSNEVIINGLMDGQEALNNLMCDNADTAVETEIIPYLSVPLVQGTIFTAFRNDKLPLGSTNGSLGAGHAFSRALLPLMDDAASDSAEVIDRNLKFQLTSDPVPDGFPAVINALRLALPGMTTDCGSIGLINSDPTANVCTPGSPPTTPTAPATPTAPTTPDPPTPPAPTPTVPAPVDTPAPTLNPTHPPVERTPADIAFGRYTFSSLDVAEGDSSFALDIRDMFKADNVNEARDIYKDGRNAVTKGLSGEVGTISLASLSTQASSYMEHDPMFNFYKYALYSDDDLEDDSGEDFVFADEVVREALVNGKDQKLGAEASVVMNVWMVITHQLYEAVRQCKDSQNPQELIDSAVALWIGQGQHEGKYKSGWMLYSVGQASDEFFGIDEGEAAVNTLLMTNFNEAQTLSKQCPTSPLAYTKLRLKSFEIIRNLTKPLVKTLLFHMVASNKNMVELYAVAVVPQCAACDITAFEALKSALFSGYSKGSALNKELIDHLVTFFRCLRITCEDLKVTDAAEPGLQDLVSDLCGKLGDDKNSALVGYEPATDVTEVARIDLDVYQIGILMETQSYQAALEYYMHGANSISHVLTDSLLSLHALATSPGRLEVEQYSEFRSYYGSDDYADDIVVQAISTPETIVPGATRRQKAEAVVRTLQSMVSYMAVLHKMQTSLAFCKASNMAEAQRKWDEAVALFVGSMEGTTVGGRHREVGQLLYGLGNELCPDFDECEPSGEAKVNEQIMFHFANARDSVKEGECDHVERVMTWDILPSMLIPLVRATLYYSVSNADLEIGTDDVLASSGFIASKAIEPLVAAVNQTSATTLKNNFKFDLTSQLVADGDDAVFEAIAYALRAMGVDCNDVGELVEAPDVDDVCIAEIVEDVAPHPDTPTNLGDELYITTTYVQDRANIALDVRDMMAALNEGSKDLARLLYRDGENSQIFDENGQLSGRRSLRGFSTEATLDMLNEPVFNIFMFGLQDSDQLYMGREARLYADTFIDESFKLSIPSSQTLPAEAAVVLNLWMYLVHTLQGMLDGCKNKEIRGTDGVIAIDAAVAYWIGDGQIAGDSERGHLLYALSEQMGERFGTDEGGQTRVNTNILKLFNAVKNELSLPNACSESPNTYVRLRALVDKIISQMSVPLIQGLIHSLRVNDRDRVKMYAHAFVPLIAGCQPSTFNMLHGKLLNLEYNVVEVDDLIELIRSVYPCLGLQCEDIGVHETEKTDEGLLCQDTSGPRPLTSYIPTSDVREYSQLDLDLLHIDILLQMNAYPAAEDIYVYGKHSTSGEKDTPNLSLSKVATTSERTIVPEFDSFARFYDSDSYADGIIRGALSSNTMSDAERRSIVIRSCQVLIMYFGALEAAYQAVSECDSGVTLRSVAASESWDKAAALLIGHLEGTVSGGTDDGYLLYDLAQEHCEEFGTCSDDGTVFNDRLVTLLYTGRGAVAGKSCSGLRKVADELSSLILVPMIQATLSAASRIAFAGNSEYSKNKAEGFVFSRGVLPLIEDVNRNSADTINSKLDLTGPKLSRSDVEKIYGAFASVYPELDVDCTLIGGTDMFDACTGVSQGSSRSTGTTIGIIVGVVLGICGACCLAFHLRSRNQKSLPENRPNFVEPKGEFNNHTTELIEKAFGQTKIPSPTRTTKDYNDASPPFDGEYSEQERLRLAPDII